MNTVHIYRLHATAKLFACLKAAQMEAAKVWNLCCEIHKQARMEHAKWPGRNDLQKATKGHFALHSQSVQMVVHAFLAFPMISFAKGGGMSGKTLTAGDAFLIDSGGTSKPDSSFKVTNTAPTDGVELVTVTPQGGTATLALFLGNSKGELITNGKAVAVKLK